MSLSKPAGAGMWDQYLLMLESHPIRTKSITAAVLSVVSDVLAQKLSRPGTPILLHPVLNQALVGLVIRGPLIHYWFSILEKLFANWAPDSMSTAVAKVLTDQILFSPFYNLFYFYVIGLLENESMTQIQNNISKDFKNVMMMNYKVWPLVNLVNFALVPPKLRVLFGNIISIFWIAFVILRTQQSKKKDENKQAKQD